MKKTNTLLAIAAATFLTGTMFSADALAHKAKKHHSVKKHTAKKSKVHAAEAAPAAYAPVAAAPAAAAYDDSALKQRIAELENRPAPVAPAKTKDNMVFFRGGWAHGNNHRQGISIYDPNLPLTLGNNAGSTSDKDSWYFGAGLDFSVDDSLFGLMPNTEVLGEVMFEYKEFSNHVWGNGLAGSAFATTGLGGQNVTVSQFTLAASPKIKFLKGSDFRPWIIPVGFNINVISPPSNSVTVLQPGMMFGLGADYRIWKNIYVGADARYHQALGSVDGVNTNGFTLGGYLGLGF
jgi:hypothetical protein